MRFIPSEVDGLIRQWVDKARADARANGERLPPPWSRLPHYEREPMFREGTLWFRLASGDLLEQAVQPQPTGDEISNMHEHLARCCEQLHTMMDARGDLLPAGTHEQMAVIEQRIAMTLDTVESTHGDWSGEQEAAWAELVRWAYLLGYSRETRSGAVDRWMPEGWHLAKSGPA
ncbi:hypothetical protein ACGFRG_25620 [Streptomyces sp. NPDC048696]|uniref:hypothetical protein n=1 Tax=Streptomyces sp. NPDC048696 TaxID=3365585 RepID=UPI003718A2FC